MPSTPTKRSPKRRSKASKPKKCVFCGNKHNVAFDPCEKAIEFFNSAVTKTSEVT